MTIEECFKRISIGIGTLSIYMSHFSNYTSCQILISHMFTHCEKIISNRCPLYRSNLINLIYMSWRLY